MWIGSEIVAHVNLGCVCVEESGRECESMVESVSASVSVRVNVDVNAKVGR